MSIKSVLYTFNLYMLYVNYKYLSKAGGKKGKKKYLRK